MKTFLKMLAATIAAMGLGIVLVAYDASDKAVIVSMFAGSILLNLLLGVFDMPEERKQSGSRFKVHGSRLDQAA